jgi:hypothetical protein
MTIAVTLFAPEDLHRSPQWGTRTRMTWQDLVAYVSTPAVTDDKASRGGFVLAQLFGGIRRSAHVEHVSALGLDYDHGDIQPETAHEMLGRYRNVVYTTASHTRAAPRWRAILTLSRPMTRDEHAIVWSHSARFFGAVDPATKDAARLWYAPTVRPGAPHVALAGDGAPLNVDRVLANAPKPEPRPVRTTVPRCGDRYVQVALQRECDAVASAPDGTRNATLNRSTHALARLDLPAVVIETAMLDAAKRAGLPTNESRKTIASALRARRGRS